MILMMESEERWQPVLRVYCPLKAGSIDGTDTRPHDRAIERAIKAIYKPTKDVQGDPDCTLFIGRLDPITSESTLKKVFSKYGDVLHVSLVRDIVTGMSKQYAFVEYTKQRYASRALRAANRLRVDEREILVEFECGRTLPKWIPRRLGGGFGGKKESGQLRFGGPDRPFRRPIVLGKEDPSRGGPQERHRGRLGGDRHDRDDENYRRDRERGGRSRGEEERHCDRRGNRERDTDRRRERDSSSRRPDQDGDRRDDRGRIRHKDRYGDGLKDTGSVGATQSQETAVKKEEDPCTSGDTPSSQFLITNIKQEKT